MSIDSQDVVEGEEYNEDILQDTPAHTMQQVRYDFRFLAEGAVVILSGKIEAWLAHE